MTKPARTLAFGAAATFAFLAACVLIRPGGLAANGGVSYYGSRAATGVPYALAFLTSAGSYWLAAFGVRERHVRLMLKVMALLFLGLLLTPDTMFETAHMWIGSALFVLQLLLSLWLFAHRPRWFIAACVIVELASGVAAFIYLPKPDGLLLQAQVTFQLAFVLLLARVLNDPPAS